VDGARRRLQTSKLSIEEMEALGRVELPTNGLGMCCSGLLSMTYGSETRVTRTANHANRVCRRESRIKAGFIEIQARRFGEAQAAASKH